MGAVNAGVRNTGRPTGAVPPGGTQGLYNRAMYIIAIGWLYVTVLMAMTETSIVAGVLSFVIYGLAPTALLLWLFGRPVRRRNSASKAHREHPEPPPSGE